MRNQSIWKQTSWQWGLTHVQNGTKTHPPTKPTPNLLRPVVALLVVVVGEGETVAIVTLWW